MVQCRSLLDSQNLQDSPSTPFLTLPPQKPAQNHLDGPLKWWRIPWIFSPHKCPHFVLYFLIANLYYLCHKEYPKNRHLMRKGHQKHPRQNLDKRTRQNQSMISESWRSELRMCLFWAQMGSWIQVHLHMHCKNPYSTAQRKEGWLESREKEGRRFQKRLNVALKGKIQPQKDELNMDHIAENLKKEW